MEEREISELTGSSGFPNWKNRVGRTTGRAKEIRPIFNANSQATTKSVLSPPFSLRFPSLSFPFVHGEAFSKIPR